MKKLVLILLIASISGFAIGQTVKAPTSADPLVGANLGNKGDKLIGKTWIPTYHKVNGKEVKPSNGDFSNFLASGGYDGTLNAVNNKGIWLYDAASNTLTIRLGDTSTAWELKEVTESSLILKTASEELRFTVQSKAGSAK